MSNTTTQVKPTASKSIKTEQTLWSELINSVDDLHTARCLHAHMREHPEMIRSHPGLYLKAELRVKRAQRFYVIGRSFGRASKPVLMFAGAVLSRSCSWLASQLTKQVSSLIAKQAVKPTAQLDARVVQQAVRCAL